MGNPFRDLPTGIYVIALLETWERFSYYGMRGILVLFLTAPVADGGFNWSPADALRFFGFYGAIVYLTPLLGGFLSDRILGPQRALALGAVLIAAGHFLMLLPGYGAYLIEYATGQPVVDALAVNGKLLGDVATLVMGRPTLATTAGADLATALGMAQWLVSAGFLAAIAVIALGTGFLTPASLQLVGALTDGDERRIANGFLIHYLSINAGALLAYLSVGLIGERWGWHFGLTAAGLGMLVGLLLYWPLRHHLRHQHQGGRQGDPTDRQAGASPLRNGLGLLTLLGAAMILYVITFEQFSGALNLFVQNETDRTLLGSIIPTTWVLALNPFLLILIVPVLMLLRAQRPASPPRLPSDDFMTGFLLVGLGFGLLGLIAYDAAGGGKAALPGVLAVVVVLCVAEIFIIPKGRQAAYALAPAGRKGFVMALWQGCVAVGAFFSGLVGALSQSHSYTMLFLLLAAGAMLIAATLAVSSRPLRRWTSSGQPIAGS